MGWGLDGWVLLEAGARWLVYLGSLFALGSAIFFEVSMLFALVGFISTVSYCRFLLRGDIIE